MAKKWVGRIPTVPIGSAAPLSTRPCCTTYTASLKSAQIKFITLLEQATSYNKTDKKRGHLSSKQEQDIQF